MIAIAAVLALLVGAVLGLLGGGGSILTVPALTYALGVPAKSAIAMSLMVVGSTSAVALVAHARAGHVRWRMGLVFGGVSMVGAYGGGRLARFLPATVLLVGFAALMLVAGAAMLRPRSDVAVPLRKPSAWFVVQALVVGAATGLVGAGGGFIVVPALMLLGGLGMRAAVGTSLLVIAMQASAGLAGQLSHAQIDVPLAASFVAAAAVGALLGSRWSHAVDPDRLRRGFGVLVLVCAVAIFAVELGT